MKKRFISMVSIVVFAVIGLAPLQTAQAAVGEGENEIKGIVLDNGSPVVGASVDVTCGSNVKHFPSTGSDGSYSVGFAPAECPAGSQALVVAKSADGTKIGSGITIVIPIGPFIITINIDIVPTTPVPEYGWVGGLAAGGLGLGAIAFTRRRFVNPTTSRT